MVSNIRMEYNISINRCVRLILLHKSVFYYTPKERGDELLRMRMKEIAATRVRYGFWRIFGKALWTIINAFIEYIVKKV